MKLKPLSVKKGDSVRVKTFPHPARVIEVGARKVEIRDAFGFREKVNRSDILEVLDQKIVD